MTTEERAILRRRRGIELEADLLEAAWDELVESGFSKLTMESVANRAKTGIAVLYRRWANKEALVLAAMTNHLETHPIEVPDTGTLRDDLVAALTVMGVQNATFLVVMMSAAFSGLLAGAGITPTQLRDRILGGRASAVPALFRRAHERGEINLDRIPRDVLSLPGDLVRHDLLMHLQPLTPRRILTIVDEIFLPLIGNVPR